MQKKYLGTRWHALTWPPYPNLTPFKFMCVCALIYVVYVLRFYMWLYSITSINLKNFFFRILCFVLIRLEIVHAIKYHGSIYTSNFPASIYGLASFIFDWTSVTNPSIHCLNSYMRPPPPLYFEITAILLIYITPDIFKSLAFKWIYIEKYSHLPLANRLILANHDAPVTTHN